MEAVHKLERRIQIFFSLLSNCLHETGTRDRVRTVETGRGSSSDRPPEGTCLDTVLPRPARGDPEPHPRAAQQLLAMGERLDNSLCPGLGSTFRRMTSQRPRAQGHAAPVSPKPWCLPLSSGETHSGAHGMKNPLSMPRLCGKSINNTKTTVANVRDHPTSPWTWSLSFHPPSTVGGEKRGLSVYSEQDRYLPELEGLRTRALDMQVR